MIQRRQQMRSFDQKRSPFASCAFDTGDYCRPETLSLGGDIGDRMLGAKGKAMEFRAVLLAMLSLDDLADEAGTDAMVEADTPSELARQRGFAGSGRATTQNNRFG